MISSTTPKALDPHTRKKAEFYVQQITNALAPSNFVLTNPEVLRETLASSGDNLVRGMKMLAEDIEAGHGTLRIRQSDPSNLEVGVNMATTPGKVIFQNELMQLIQYAPSTESVLRTPLLIVPPWINKFYILDLKPEKSFIKWCVDQGVTVFVISWVNPDKSLGAKTWEDYMKEGPLAAMDAIEKATGEMKVHTMGYCVGGTLLATTLAWLAEKRRVRVTSATLLAAQVDFTHAGDLLVFVDEGQISALERDMQESGVLEGAKMAMAFNMLRSNDLIWQYVVSNYLKGQPPSSFDLLHWNSDATRMPAANHSYYLRNCYLENRLSAGSMVLDNTLLDLSKIKVPIYNLATREDHIAPADSVLYGSQFFGGPVKFVLSGSGHIAGVVNPPSSGKYQYWTNDNIRDVTLAGLDQGRAGAQGLVVARLARVARQHRRRAGAGAHRRHRRAAADRGRARQLCPRPRVAQRRALGYTGCGPAGTRSRNSNERGKAMTRELFWLTLTVILTGLLWIPYILNRCQVRGLSGAMANPSRNDKPHAEWATRLMFAHDNAVENLVIFAPLVLILAQIDYSTKWTVYACAVYFWARVAHIVVYTLGLPVFRTLAFTVGFFAQAVLALAIFKVV